MPSARFHRRRMLGVSGLAAATAIAAAGVATASAAGAAPTPSTGSGRVSLRNSAPAWTRQAPAGTVPGHASIAVRVYLAPRGGTAALEQAAEAVSTPGNPSYHHFLDPSQFRARFAPSDQQVAAVASWLASAGFHVTSVEASRRYLTAAGTAAAVPAAFGVSLKTFRRGGVAVAGPDADASVPDNVASYVTGVDGLASVADTVKPLSIGNEASSAQPTQTSTLAPSPPGFTNARPCSLYYGQLTATRQADYKTPLPTFNGAHVPYAVCGYVPAQFRAAYGVSSTPLTGKGVTVGIIDAYAAPTMEADANRYARNHGDPGFTRGQFTQTLPKAFRGQKQCDPGSWYGEETLDVEAVHGIAPAANVHYYAAASCLTTDLNATLAKALDDNKVSVISNSYGEPDQQNSSATLIASHQLFLQAGLQGISLLFSSGDNGDEVANTALKQTDSSASDPAVTAVGGTSTAIGSSGATLFQTGWGTEKATLGPRGLAWSTPAYVYGAGGGYSALFNRPVYQRGVVESAHAGRAVPDIAADGDPTTGMLVGETQTFPSGVRYGENRVGGTSLASPLAAGMVALATQRTGGRLGFLNPAIYAAARNKTGAFTDVLPVHTGDANVRPDFVNSVDASNGISYSVRTFDQDSSLRVTPGWDDVTGVGTLNANFLKHFGG